MLVKCSQKKYIRFVVISAMASLLAGCVGYLSAFVKNDSVTLSIAEENANYIRRVGVFLKADNTFVRGRVRRGIKSHIPHMYQGHIHISVVDTTGAMVEASTVRLSGKQDYFSQRLKTTPLEGSVVHIVYHKRA